MLLPPLLRVLAVRQREIDVENLLALRSSNVSFAGQPDKTLLRIVQVGGVRRRWCAMTDDLQQRIDARVRLLLEAVERDQIRMSGDLRVSEAAANYLIGFDGEDTLKKLREFGRGPTFHRVGVNGSRISYALEDLASWIESRRVEQG